MQFFKCMLHCCGDRSLYVFLHVPLHAIHLPAKAASEQYVLLRTIEDYMFSISPGEELSALF
jgi:hypothetical protein